VNRLRLPAAADRADESPAEEAPPSTVNGIGDLVVDTEIRRSRLPLGWVIAGLGAVTVSATLGLVIGPVDLGVGTVARELVGLPSGMSEAEQAILWQIRLPRVVLGLLVGATLALAGAGYQGVFRNPLADPYLLGAAAGAGLGVTIAIVGTSAGAPLPLSAPVAAFAGALVAVALTYVLGAAGGAGGASASTASLILAGVAVASFLTASQTYLQQRHRETLQEVYSWILGRLFTVGWREVAIMAPYFAVTALVLLAQRRTLDVLAVGDDEAATLGLHARRTRVVVVVAASLGTAAAVSVSGLIGFVGIIVPHTVRLLAGASHRVILPLSLLFGGAFLVLADLAARTLASPAEIPIGVVTAFFGAPFFVLVLRTSKRLT
jgi:iron complex transport system permease protein